MAASSTTRHGNGSSGPGWGGPARGAGNGSPRHKFTEPGPGRGYYSIAGEVRAEQHARHAEEMREILYDIAHTAQEPNLQIQAAVHLLNRIEGLPVAKTEQPGEVKITIEGGLPRRDVNNNAAAAAHER
ncbi:MAG: hypothetical protein ACYCPH_03425 [Minisyncoccota bacterium]